MRPTCSVVWPKNCCRSEAEALLNRDCTAERAALDLGPFCDMAVVTDGANGSCISALGHLQVPRFPYMCSQSFFDCRYFQGSLKPLDPFWSTQNIKTSRVMIDLCWQQSLWIYFVPGLRFCNSRVFTETSLINKAMMFLMTMQSVMIVKGGCSAGSASILVTFQASWHMRSRRWVCSRSAVRLAV